MAAREAVGHAWQPHHPMGCSCLVLADRCLGKSFSESIPFGFEFLGLDELATGWRRVESEGPVCCGAIAVLYFGGGGGGARCHADQVGSHVFSFSEDWFAVRF